MDSAPRTSPDAAASDGGAGARPEFGGSLAARVRPRQRLGRRSFGRATGDVVRRSVEFATVLGLSTVGRWARRRAEGPDVDHLAVRPPIDYWPWAADETDDTPTPSTAVTTASRIARRSAATSATRRATRSTPSASAGAATTRAERAERAERPSTPARPAAGGRRPPASWGTDKLDELAQFLGVSAPVVPPTASSPTGPDRVDVDRSIAGPALRRRSPGRAQQVRRGLPIAAARGGATVAGPATSPGAIASGLRAELDATPPSPAANVRRSAAAPASRTPAGGFGSRVGPGPGAPRADASQPRRRQPAPPRATPAGERPPLEALPPDIQALRSRLEAGGMVPPATAPAAPDGAVRSFDDSRVADRPTTTPTAGSRAGRPASAPPVSDRPRTPGSWREHGSQWRWRLEPQPDRSAGPPAPAPHPSTPAQDGPRARNGERPVDPGGTAPSMSAADDTTLPAGVTDLALRPRPIVSGHPAGTVARADELGVVRRLPAAIAPLAADRATGAATTEAPVRPAVGRPATGLADAPPPTARDARPLDTPDTDRTVSTASRDAAVARVEPGPTPRAHTDPPRAPSGDHEIVRRLPSTITPPTPGTSDTDRTPGAASHDAAVRPAVARVEPGPKQTPTPTPPPSARTDPSHGPVGDVVRRLPSTITVPTADVDQTPDAASHDAAVARIEPGPTAPPRGPAGEHGIVRRLPSTITPPTADADQTPDAASHDAAVRPAVARVEPRPTTPPHGPAGDHGIIRRLPSTITPPTSGTADAHRTQGTASHDAAVGPAVARVEPRPTTPPHGPAGDHGIIRRLPSTITPPTPATADADGTPGAASHDAAVRPAVARVEPGPTAPARGPAGDLGIVRRLPSAITPPTADADGTPGAASHDAGVRPAVGRVDAGRGDWPSAAQPGRSELAAGGLTLPTRPPVGPGAVGAVARALRDDGLGTAVSLVPPGRPIPSGYPSAAVTPRAVTTTAIAGRHAEPDVVRRAGIDAVAAPTPAETFAAELARHRTERPRAIPVTYRPLATAIVGDRPVHVSASVASRRALAKVGKVAATTGDTIHLASPAPRPDVIAHELTHIAHPSPVARFFDDDDHSPEERQAEQVAAIMRRAPVLPRTSAAGGTRGPTVAPASDVVRRTVSTGAGTASAGTVSAAALADQITRGSSETVRRVIGGHRTQRPAQPPAEQPAQQPSQDGQPSGVGIPVTQPETVAPVAQAAPADLSQQFEHILELLEARILRELERRGGRFRGGF